MNLLFWFMNHLWFEKHELGMIDWRNYAWKEMGIYLTKCMFVDKCSFICTRNNCNCIAIGSQSRKLIVQYVEPLNSPAKNSFKTKFLFPPAVVSSLSWHECILFCFLHSWHEGYNAENKQKNCCWWLWWAHYTGCPKNFQVLFFSNRLSFCFTLLNLPLIRG